MELPKAGAENLDTEAEKVAEEAFEKDLEGALGLVFESKEEMERYARDRHPELASVDRAEELKQKTEKERKNFVDALKEADPRFGSRDEYVQMLSAKFLEIPSGEERIAFLRGFASFRQGHGAQREIRGKMEAAEKGGKGVSFGPADDLVVKGLLYRDILDSSVTQNVGMSADFNFGAWYEKVSGHQVFASLQADYERMINEGKGHDESPLNKEYLANDLRKVGFSVLGEGKERFTLAYRAESGKGK